MLFCFLRLPGGRPDYERSDLALARSQSFRCRSYSSRMVASALANTAAAEQTRQKNRGRSPPLSSPSIEAAAASAAVGPAEESEMKRRKQHCISLTRLPRFKKAARASPLRYPSLSRPRRNQMIRTYGDRIFRATDGGCIYRQEPCFEQKVETHMIITPNPAP